jgi:hypothetical protein
LNNCALTTGLGGLVDQYSIQHGQGNLASIVKEIDKMIVEEKPSASLMKLDLPIEERSEEYEDDGSSEEA